jgi:hypothetical protein
MHQPDATVLKVTVALANNSAIAVMTVPALGAGRLGDQK